MRAQSLRRMAVAVAASSLLLMSTAGSFAVSASSGTWVVTTSTTLTADHVGAILIETDGVTLDCAGHTVYGPDAGDLNGGISVHWATVVTVRNCVVSGFNVNGIYSIGSAGLRLVHNTVDGNHAAGIWLEQLSGAVVTGNRLLDSGDNGLVLYSTTDMRVKDNIARDNTSVGILLVNTTGTVVDSNTAIGNATGFSAGASSANSFISNTASHNLGDGFIVYETTGGVVRGNRSAGNGTGGFSFVTSSDLRIAGNVAENNGPDGGNGFLFLASSDLRVEDNTAQGSPWACFGLYDGTHSATLVGNKASGCSAGFDIGTGSYGNRLRGNTANGNIGGNGFSLYDTTGNALTSNTANGNNNGFLLGGASGNTLARNTANTNASYGFVADGGATANTFSDNAAHQNDRSHTDCLDALDTGSGNTWTHNHFGTTSGI